MDYKVDYRDRYNRLLDAIKELQKANPSDEGIQNWVNDTVPELSESEDERIRKWLIAQLELKSDVNNPHDLESMILKSIAWLEKQDNTPKEFTCTQEVEVGNGNINALVTEKIIIDNVEPKFKVGKPKFHNGEWITNGEDVWQIDEVKTENYLLIDSEGILFAEEIATIDSEFHIWTITDAKDGDVVVDKSYGTIGIFQSIGHHPDGGSCNDPSYCFLHCRYNYGFFYADFEDGNMIDSDDLIPATKEERDTLMKAMTDDGYTFDFEKKELKRIEQKSLQWKISDYRTWQYIVSDVLTKHDGIGQYLDDGFCKNIAKYMQENWSKKLSLGSNHVWSEEDEKNWRGVIDEIEANKSSAPDYDVETYDRFLSWIKSLKQRLGGEK